MTKVCYKMMKYVMVWFRNIGVLGCDCAVASVFSANMKMLPLCRRKGCTRVSILLNIWFRLTLGPISTGTLKTLYPPLCKPPKLSRPHICKMFSYFFHIMVGNAFFGLLDTFQRILYTFLLYE